MWNELNLSSVILILFSNNPDFDCNSLTIEEKVLTSLFKYLNIKK